MEHKCPTHETPLVGVSTKWGFRFRCTIDACTVACWDGSTSTPADDETRALRHKCHEFFDPLWKKRKKFKNRNDAYRWLSQSLGLKAKDAHIGMFNKEQCLSLLEILLQKPNVMTSEYVSVPNR